MLRLKAAKSLLETRPVSAFQNTTAWKCRKIRTTRCEKSRCYPVLAKLEIIRTTSFIWINRGLLYTGIAKILLSSPNNELHDVSFAIQRTKQRYRCKNTIFHNRTHKATCSRRKSKQKLFEAKMCCRSQPERTMERSRKDFAPSC